MLSLGSWDAADGQEDVGERSLGWLCVLPPLLETSLVLTWDYGKAECSSRSGRFLYTECGRYTARLSLAFFAAVKTSRSESGLGVERGTCHGGPSTQCWNSVISMMFVIKGFGDRLESALVHFLVSEA